MNIDYGKIIETAEQRRAALEKLNALIELAPRYLEMLDEATGHAKALKAAWDTLDAEGRKLLPGILQQALTYLSPAMYERLLVDTGMTTTPIGLRIIARHATRHE